MERFEECSKMIKEAVGKIKTVEHDESYITYLVEPLRGSGTKQMRGKAFSKETVRRELGL